MGEIKGGESVVVFGCGPGGIVRAKGRLADGRGRVIAVDQYEYRLQFARDYNNVETVNFREVGDPVMHLKEMTGRSRPGCLHRRRGA